MKFQALLFLVLLIVFISEIEAQTTYACIKDGRLYTYEYARATQGSVQRNYILSRQRSSSFVTKTEIPSFRGNKLKTTWDILNDQLVSAVAVAFPHSNPLASVRLSKLEAEDTLAVSIKHRSVIDSLSNEQEGKELHLAIANYEFDRRMKFMGRWSKLLPLYRWWLMDSSHLHAVAHRDKWTDEVVRKSFFDITTYKNDIFVLIRKGSLIEIWEWNYSQPVINGTQDAWVLIKSFETGDILNSLNLGAVSYTDTLNTPISVAVDSNMLEGRLKLIVQNDNMFVFNLSTAKIYHLDQDIQAVGELLTNKKTKHNSYADILLLENKDEECLITSQLVKRYEDALVFPCLRENMKEELEPFFE